ncbi:MAG: DUF4157 domain-containing protein [Thermodesulfobacteriota bacterium]
MASLSQARRAQKGTPKPAPAQKPAAQAPAAAGPPAYLRRRLPVSQPGDPAEQQADRVAGEVRRAAKERPAGRGQPQVGRAKALAVQAPEKERQSLAAKPVPEARRLLRSQAPVANEATVQRQAASGPEPAHVSGPAVVSPEAEERITARRGQGQPLPEGLRASLEQDLGRDLAAVRLHTDAEAAALCAQVQARAFTVGDDIYFGPGQFAPGSEAGRELLAHELTHVLQQGESGALGRCLLREIVPAPAPPHPAGSASERAANDLDTLDLPAIKQRHRPLYDSYAGSGNLKRIRGYHRGRPAQVGVWNRGITVDENAVRERLTERGVPVPVADADTVNVSLGGTPFSGPQSQLLARLKIPTWDRHGRQPTNGFQVDHIVELQVSGEHGTGVGNSIENMELLDQPSNSSSGAAIMTGIRTKVIAYLATLPAPRPTPGDWLRDHDLVFRQTRISGGGSEAAAAWWSRTDIEQAEPLRCAQPLPPSPVRGEPDLFVLASGAAGIEIGRFPKGVAESTITPAGPAARRLAGLVLRQIQLTDAAAGTATGVPIGQVLANWDLPAKFQNPADLLIPLVSVGAYAGHLGAMPALNADFTPLSETSFPAVSVQGNRLAAEGRLVPSLPLLGNTAIVVALDGGDLSFRMDYTPENLHLRLPGVEIDEALISIGYSTASGFGVQGSLFFTVRSLGEGSLTAAVDEAGGFSARGELNADTRLFDRARIAVWYRNRQFGGEGDLGIDRPDKIRGIRSAAVHAEMSENSFAATGTVQPSIPGVQQAGLTVGYSEAAGLTIGGSLQLAPNPAIRSGSVEVTVQKREADWRVSATGQAQPAIPGVDSQLAVSYDDGSFTAEFSGAFRRGMLSGTVTAGATNRPVGEDGRPAGEAAPDAPLVVYGSGQATIRLAPWLAGTAGIRFDPAGEVTVSGAIGLPSQLEIFPRKTVDRSLLNIAAQIPIVPGIVAEIGGSLSAQAGIGPGAIDQLQLAIEYTPAHEDRTHVTGDAHLNIPADAGLRLAARAGIGLGITGASATGGLEVGGSLGVAGAAEAGVHIDWQPAGGLTIDAFGALTAQPRFRFDLSGYVAVRALGFSVYDNRWELAAMEIGSDYQFGVRFPVHYREGQAFDISLSDVEFQVPDVNPRQLLDQVVARLA